MGHGARRCNPHHRVGRADPCRQHPQPRRPRQGTLEFRARRHLRREPRSRTAGLSRRLRSFRGADPQRPFHCLAGRVREDKRGGHLHFAGGGARSGDPFSSRINRRGLRRAAPRQRRALHRGEPLPPLEPLQLHKGVGRHARARLGANLRHSGHDLQLLKQLRALSARGEVHPPARSPTSSRDAGRNFTAAGATFATGYTSTTTRARCGRSCSRAKSAKPT